MGFVRITYILAFDAEKTVLENQTQKILTALVIENLRYTRITRRFRMEKTKYRRSFEIALCKFVNHKYRISTGAHG